MTEVPTTPAKDPSKAPAPAHYVILAEDKRRLIVKLNPAAYIAKPHGTLIGLNPGQITFNTMYSHKGKPIGPWWFEGKWQKSLKHNKGLRPFIEFSNLVMEAGPHMISGGRDCLAEGMKVGGFQSDVLRKANHTIFATTKLEGKDRRVGIAFYEDTLLSDAIEDMRRAFERGNPKNPIWNAINCDGGDKAHLAVDGQVRGLKEPLVGISLTLK